MNEGRGQVVHDWSGNGNDGRLGSSAAADTSDPQWLGKSPLSALRFDGIDDYVAIPDSTSLEPARVSVGAVFRGLGSPGQWRYLVSKGALACRTGSYGLYSGFGGGLGFYVSNGNDFVVSPELGSWIWDGGWHVAVGTYDGTTVRLYVDGVEVGSGTPASLEIGYDLPANDGAYVGSYEGDCSLSLRGDLGQVSIWSVALPLNQLALYVAASRR